MSRAVSAAAAGARRSTLPGAGARARASPRRAPRAVDPRVDAAASGRFAARCFRATLSRPTGALLGARRLLATTDVDGVDDDDGGGSHRRSSNRRPARRSDGRDNPRRRLLSSSSSASSSPSPPRWSSSFGLSVPPSSSLSKQSATSPPDYPLSDRWRAVPPANAVHLSIGAVYVYSMWTPGMTSALGVVGSAPGDWTHSEVLPVFSTAAVTLGVTTSLLGAWVERSGPRLSGTVGSLCWGSGLCVSGLGVHFHSLPLVYLGYGLLGGVGWGLMYLAPVTTVMKWFPDRRGLATGIALSAFGAGAAVAPTVIHAAIDCFASSPDFVGPLAIASFDAANAGADAAAQCVRLETLPDGSQVVAPDSPAGTPGTKVVVATEADLSKLSGASHSGPGAYALGTGDTGTAKALGALGVLYGALGLIGSRFMRVPHHDWMPALGATPDAKAEAEEAGGGSDGKQAEINHDIGLPASYVTTNTVQFPLLWLSVFGNATGGLALLSSSKLMLTDIWRGAAPDVVTGSFATGYVSALGIGMAAGRFGWSALSDRLGRRNTYAVFGLALPIMGSVPALVHAASTAAADGTGGAGVAPLLAVFYGGSVLAITFYGGIFSVLPAYIADLFGQRHSGAIHGKALTAWAASAVAGPMGLAYLRSRSVDGAVADLVGRVDDAEAFQRAFGCDPADAEAVRLLAEARTITIPRLMEVVPEGTVDPTPFLYDSTCYAAAGLIGVSAVANLCIRPLDVRKTLRELEEKDDKAEAGKT